MLGLGSFAFLCSFPPSFAFFSHLFSLFFLMEHRNTAKRLLQSHTANLGSSEQRESPPNSIIQPEVATGGAAAPDSSRPDAFAGCRGKKTPKTKGFCAIFNHFSETAISVGAKTNRQTAQLWCAQEEHGLTARNRILALF